MESEVGQRIQVLRKQCGLSIRQLARLAGVTLGIISCIERGKNSPSLATLQKILHALGTDLAAFFARQAERQEGPVFAREHMRRVSDRERNYTIVFPRRPEIALEMFDEYIYPAARRPEFEKVDCDVAGYVISGTLALQIKGHR